jgi:hypothetical protein
MIHLPKSVMKLAALASKEPGRFATHGVKVTEQENGRYRVEATDGRIAAILTGDGTGPDRPDLAAVPNTATSAVIPAKEWAGAFRGMKETKWGTPLRAAVVLGERVTTVSPELGKLAQVPNVEPTDSEGHPCPPAPNRPRFPNIDTARPDGEPVVTLEVSADFLCRLLAAAVEVAPRGESPVLRIRFYRTRNGENVNPFTVEAKGADGQDFYGLVMPIGWETGQGAVGQASHR